MLPNYRKSTQDPAVVHARLVETIADLQAQRDALVRSFSTYREVHQTGTEAGSESEPAEPTAEAPAPCDGNSSKDYNATIPDAAAPTSAKGKEAIGEVSKVEASESAPLLEVDAAPVNSPDTVDAATSERIDEEVHTSRITSSRNDIAPSSAISASKTTLSDTTIPLLHDTQKDDAAQILGEPPTPVLGAVTPEDMTKALELARSTIKKHIRLLHGYNEIRDVGQGLFGILAEQKGVRIVQIMEEFGVGKDD